MECFEIIIATSSISLDGGPFIPDERLTYIIPEKASERLESILGRHGESPTWYFDKLNYGRPPAPWAIACLDREYSIAGHVVSTRPSGKGIAFAAYTRVPQPISSDFVPDVGTLVIRDKSYLEEAADASPLFRSIWNELRDRSSESRWLLLVDPLPAHWLAEITPGDRERWFAYRASVRSGR